MWQIAFDAHGNPYYYNYASRCSQYDAPLEGFWDASSTIYYRDVPKPELETQQSIRPIEPNTASNTNTNITDMDFAQAGHYIPWVDIALHEISDNTKLGMSAVWGNQDVALLRLPPGSHIDEEAKRLCFLGNHPSVVKIFGISTDVCERYLVTELPPCGSLDHVLSTCEEDISNPVLLRAAMEICQGVEHLFMNSVLAGVIATSSVGVFAFDPQNEKSLHVKIIYHDFIGHREEGALHTRISLHVKI